MTLTAPESLDIATLPSLALSERKALPKSPAIYFVLDGNQVIHYIGQTKSLYIRWRGHHLLATFKQVPQMRIAYLAVTDVALLPDIEQALIHHFDPPLNLKPGRQPNGDVDTHVLLPHDLIEWAKNHPEGLSGLCRRLLAAERARTQRRASS